MSDRAETIAADVMQRFGHLLPTYEDGKAERHRFYMPDEPGKRWVERAPAGRAPLPKIKREGKNHES